jgi:PAS domain S-box-containing protein
MNPTPKPHRVPLRPALVLLPSLGLPLVSGGSTSAVALERPHLSLPAMVAVLLAGVVLTAVVLRWFNRRRLRGDSQRLMRIARHPDEGELLRPHISDGGLADAAQVIADERRQLQALGEQLRLAKERLEEVQRAASMGSWRLDVGSGRIEWSDQAHLIFGVPLGDEFPLERLLSLVHPEDLAPLNAQRQALIAGSADLDMAHRIERPGGEERVVHVRGTAAARDAAGRPTALVGTVQDVTEAWEASGLSDALARALALSADPVLMTREHAGIWLWAWSNRAWDRLCEQLLLDGREADHQLFNPHTGLLRAHAARAREARAQRKVLRLDLEMATPQGQRWFEAELIPQVGAPGRAGHGLLLLRDRSVERRAAQALRDANARLERVVGERTAALARSEQQYRVLADLSPQILWQADREGRVSYLNRAWHELVGPREGGWLGLRWMDALHPDDVAASMDAITTGLRDGQPWQARRRFKSAGGAYRSLLGVAAPLRSESGAVEGWVGVEADITELERHAARLQQLNAELETFSYTVSHDLRAPVHVVKGFVEALLAGQVGQIDEQARGYLERVLRGARRMDELIADLLALARLSRETLQLSRFDPGELALALVEAIQERYPGRVIECSTSGGGLLIEADRRLFQVMLENLLDNAAKFSAGRPVCRIELSWQREREEVVLELADNGVGFPPEFTHRLFRPYQRLHAQGDFPGNGIGLATVARIVQLHGGTISAHNREQGGTLFRIRLPLAAAPAAPSRPAMTSMAIP